MSESFLGLIHNIALLLAMVLIFDMAGILWRSSQPKLWEVLIGVLLGGIGMAVMLTPWQLYPGVFFDTRSVLLSVAGLFLGWIPTLIAMFMTASLRIFQGGNGAFTGTSVIFATGLIGLVWRQLRRKPLMELTTWEMYLFGIITHIVMLLLMLTLPWQTAQQVLSSIALPVLIIYPIGTALLGSIMINRLRREKMVDRLRESEERLRLAVAAASIGFFDRDYLENKEHYSPEWKRQIGFVENELSDDVLEWETRVHPDDFPNVQAKIENCFRNRSSEYEAEYRLRHKDDSYRWILARGLFQFNKSGKPTRLLGCHIDITRQKQIEQDILLSERRFRGLAESSQDYIMLYDRECRHVYENPAALKVSGFCEADIIGKTHRELGYQPELCDLWEQEILQVFETGKPSNRLFEWDSALGRIYLDWRISPVYGANGSIDLVLGISRDITALKQAEQALLKKEDLYRVLTENIIDVVWILDVETRYFRYVSPSIFQQRGYTVEEILANPVDHALTDDKREAIMAVFRSRIEAFRTGQVSQEKYYLDEVEQPCKDGSKIWTEMISSFYINPENNHIEARGVARVITERKAAEEKLKTTQAELQNLLAKADQSRRVLLSMTEDQKNAQEQISQLNAELEQRVHERTAQLEAANKELEAFAYSVSHDLRSPLRALDGFSEALLTNYAKNLDEQGQHYLFRIQAASRRMGQLINDLLNLSRITRSEFNRQRVDLSSLAREICLELKSQEPQRKVDCYINDDMVVQGDGRLLRIVLENLINNAFKFTGPRAKAVIEIGKCQINREVVYFVRDNGVGFEMAYAGKLFAPFQRLHGMQEYPGTGIGLVTVQRIITRHGGRIWPEAELEKGATFYFTLGGM
jgi:PAS domain S-box-containing protein